MQGETYHTTVVELTYRANHACLLQSCELNPKCFNSRQLTVSFPYLQCLRFDEESAVADDLQHQGGQEHGKHDKIGQPLQQKR